MLPVDENIVARWYLDVPTIAAAPPILSCARNNSITNTNGGDHQGTYAIGHQ